jgi:uncharacterized protein (TIGR02996 family)
MSDYNDEQRQRFIDALAEDEDDEATRLVFSDWLEERGEYEEAERQREWGAAKAWLMGFVEENSDRDYDTRLPMTDYRQLIERGRRAAEAGDWHIYCGADEELMHALYASHESFWKNWSIIAGIPLPESDHIGSFSCGC